MKYFVYTIIVVFGLAFWIYTPWGPLGVNKIVGGNPGKYHDGDYVMGLSKNLLFRDFKKGDVIIFNIPDYNDQGEFTGYGSMIGIGEIVGLSNDPINSSTYYYSQQQAFDSVPLGFYAISLNKSNTWRLIPRDSVTRVVIYP